MRATFSLKQRSRSHNRSVTGCVALWLALATLLTFATLEVVAPVVATGQTVAQRPSGPFIERPETDVLLLAVLLDRETVSDSVTAYAAGPQDVLLPLGEICRVLGFAIDVDVVNGRASGFFISESRLFRLDARQRIATVNGRETPVPAEQVEIHEDDIYVKSRLLSAWFPLDVAIDFNAAAVLIHAREPLPAQIAAARSSRLGAAGAAAAPQPEYPAVANPYSLLDVPTVDASMTVNSDESPENRFRYSVLANGDVLHLTGTIFARGTLTGGSDVRGTLGKRDPDATLLGPLQAREFGVGDVYFPGMDLISQGYSGPGVSVSNFPLTQQNRYQSQTLTGNLPLGWDVELFRNGALIAFQQTRPDGRYEFKEIALLFGMNVFRLVFHGPQGQQREEVQTFNIGENLVPPGRFRYRVVGNRPKEAGRRFMALGGYGVTDHVTLTGSASEVTFEGSKHEYVTAGVNGYWQRYFLYGDLATDSGKGFLARAGLQSRVGTVTIGAEHAESRDFESEVLRSLGGGLRRRTILRLAGAVGPYSVYLPFTLDLTRDEYADGGRTYTTSAIVSTFLGGFSLSDRLFGTVGHLASSRIDELQGSFLVSRNVRSVSVRGQYDYTLTPRLTSSMTSLRLEDRRRPPYLFGGQISHEAMGGLTHFMADVSRDQGLFSFGMSADFTTNRHVLVTFNLASTLSRNPFSGRWQADARAGASQGAAAARVFLDTNANGRFDPSEKLVEGAQFLVNRGTSVPVTNSRGEALLTNLPPDVWTDVSLSSTSLEDPLWVPARSGIRFVPRPGKVATLDFPVLVTGEITGTVYLAQGAARREVAGIRIELVDAGGDVKKSVRTAYDGFYDMTGVPPGAYLLRALDPLAAGVRGPARNVTIPSEGSIIDGMDFVIARTAADAMQIQPASEEMRRERARQFDALIPPP